LARQNLVEPFFDRVGDGAGHSERCAWAGMPALSSHIRSMGVQVRPKTACRMASTGSQPVRYGVAHLFEVMLDRGAPGSVVGAAFDQRKKAASRAATSSGCSSGIQWPQRLTTPPDAVWATRETDSRTSDRRPQPLS